MKYQCTFQITPKIDLKKMKNVGVENLQPLQVKSSTLTTASNYVQVHIK